MKQQDMFPHLFVAKKYDVSREDAETAEILWPPHEVMKDICTVSRMLDMTAANDEGARLASTVQYFSSRYGQQRGYGCFLLWRKMIAYLRYYQDELLDMRVIWRSEDGDMVFHIDFLRQLLKLMLGKAP